MGKLPGQGAPQRQTPRPSRDRRVACPWHVEGDPRSRGLLLPLAPLARGDARREAEALAACSAEAPMQAAVLRPDPDGPGALHGAGCPDQPPGLLGEQDRPLAARARPEQNPGARFLSQAWQERRVLPGESWTEDRVSRQRKGLGGPNQNKTLAESRISRAVGGHFPVIARGLLI